jgi:ferredoxin
MNHFLAAADLDALIAALASDGYDVVGPTVQQGAIVYDHVRRAADLPRGWTDEQEAGRYRLVRREDDAYFGYVVGPYSWKRFLFPPIATLLKAQRSSEGWSFEAPVEETPRYALLGVRACELAALAIQDRVFMSGDHVDPIYAERRSRLFLVAVNCTQSAPTCFCTSMDTGPRCRGGYDLALTEIDAGFVVETGSDRGRNMLGRLPVRLATNDELVTAESRREQALIQTRKLDREGVHDLLLSNLQHPHWSEVAERCLSCANCTSVCPTCFCSSVQEVSDLSGDNVERRRQWDSCFNLDFSYMNGGAVRPQIRSRYRQWLTHKLATWIDQFGTSGCVGCGRCITWCPVGIDLTAEVAAIRGDDP